MCFAGVGAHFWRRIAPVSIENRAILREIRRVFGAADARIDRKSCATIVAVVEHLPDLDYKNVIFVGDRIHPGGNDYTLAVAVEAAGGKYRNVSNWRDTRNFLSERIIINNLTTKQNNDIKEI